MSALPMSPLASIGFRWLMLYRICTLFSYQIVAVTVGWHVYELTRDPWSLGLIGLAEVIPFFCVAPFSGYLVDHLRRRRLGAIACSVLALNAIVLALLTTGVLPLQGLWPIYLAIAIGGVGRLCLGFALVWAVRAEYGTPKARVLASTGRSKGARTPSPDQARTVDRGRNSNCTSVGPLVCSPAQSNEGRT